MEIFPEYSKNTQYILFYWFHDSFDDSGYYGYNNYETNRNSIDNLIGIIILTHLKLISQDISSIIASYLDIEYFRHPLYEKHPKLFSK